MKSSTSQSLDNGVQPLVPRHTFKVPFFATCVGIGLCFDISNQDIASATAKSKCKQHGNSVFTSSGWCWRIRNEGSGRNWRANCGLGFSDAVSGARYHRSVDCYRPDESYFLYNTGSVGIKFWPYWKQLFALCDIRPIWFDIKVQRD